MRWSLVPGCCLIFSTLVQCQVSQARKAAFSRDSLFYMMQLSYYQKVSNHWFQLSAREAAKGNPNMVEFQKSAISDSIKGIENMIYGMAYSPEGSTTLESCLHRMKKIVTVQLKHLGITMAREKDQIYLANA